jgi:predicted nucleic acid-binding protein
MNAVDTNVLIYVNDSRDPGKQAIAASLVANLTEGVLIWQVACEYLAASRKLEPFGYSDIDGLKIVNPFKSP